MQLLSKAMSHFMCENTNCSAVNLNTEIYPLFLIEDIYK